MYSVNKILMYRIFLSLHSIDFESPGNIACSFMTIINTILYFRGNCGSGRSSSNGKKTSNQISHNEKLKIFWFS